MRQDELYHYGVKGMKWKDHKYKAVKNGQYIYDYAITGQGYERDANDLRNKAHDEWLESWSTLGEEHQKHLKNAENLSKQADHIYQKYKTRSIKGISKNIVDKGQDAVFEIKWTIEDKQKEMRINRRKNKEWRKYKKQMKNDLYELARERK